MEVPDIDPRKIVANDVFETRGDRKLVFLAGYGTLAPSSHNSQPWRFQVTADGITVLADRSRALPVVDPHDRELAISCGAAVGFIEHAAPRFGLVPEVVVGDGGSNQDVIARLSFERGEPASGGDIAYFDAITRHRTTRSPFGKTVVSPHVIHACEATGKTVGVDFIAISDPQVKVSIASLVAEGDQLQFDDPSFRRELALWIRSATMGSNDGMSDIGFGLPDVLAPVERFAVRTFDLGNGVAAADVRKILEGSPLLAVLSTTEDKQSDWVNTGRVLAGIVLRLTAAGLAFSYLNQPIEVASLRSKVNAAAGTEGFPQILLRIGAVKSGPPATARRALCDVVEVI
jgi:hypothetical protein